MRQTKHLRREAEEKTVGAPYARYVEGRNGSIELAPRCTKAVYQDLKRKEVVTRYAIEVGDEWFAGWSRDGARFSTSVEGAKKYDTFRQAMTEVQADQRFEGARVVPVR